MSWKLENLLDDPDRHWRDGAVEPPPINKRVLFHVGRLAFVGILVPDRGNEAEDILWESDWKTMDSEHVERWSYIRKDAGRRAA